MTARNVTPADIDPANENRLFVHVHGGAYVLNGGSAGLPEAILIANRAKIPVMSIDYRMPPGGCHRLPGRSSRPGRTMGRTCGTAEGGCSSGR